MTHARIPTGTQRMLLACVLATLTIGGTLALFQAPPAAAGAMQASVRTQAVALA